MTTQTQIIPLEQGLTLIHQEIPHISTTTIDVWVKGGSSVETIHNRGAAHFVEHMIFKGTDRMGPGDFDRLVESLGSVSSAATGHDYTRYSLTTPKDHFAKVLPYLSDLILCAAIPEGELEPERQVILAELSQAWSDPEWISYQVLLETIYDQHPYGMPVIGSLQNVESLSAKDLRTFHRDYYQGSGITVVVVGAVSIDRVIDQVRSAFSQCGSQAPSCPHHRVEPLQGIKREQINLPYLPHDRLLMAWLGPKAASMKESIGMELISLVLGSGRGSRLVKELHTEKQWVKDIDCAFLSQQAAGFFTISANLEHQYLEPVEFSILDQVRCLVSEPILALELKRAQKALTNGFAFMMESPSELAHFLGYHALLGVYEFCEHWPTAYSQVVDSITAQDLIELAQNYLHPDRYVSIRVSDA